MKVLKAFLYVLEAAIGSVGVVILLVVLDPTAIDYWGKALSVTIAFIAALLTINRIMIVEVNLNPANSKKELIRIEESLNQIQKMSAIRHFFEDEYNMLLGNKFDFEVSNEILKSVTNDRLVTTDKLFYQFINIALFEKIKKMQIENKRFKINKKVEIFAVSFNDDEWQNSPDENTFLDKSLDLIKLGVDYKRIFVLEENEIASIIKNTQYQDACRAHLNCCPPTINSKIIIHKSLTSDGAIVEAIKKFGNGFFCAKIEDIYLLIFDIVGDGTRGHIFINQQEAKKIIEAFMQIWRNPKSKGFTDILLDSNHAIDTHNHICPSCSEKEKCKKRLTLVLPSD